MKCKSLNDLLYHRAAESGDQTAYTFVQSSSDVGQSITYSDLYLAASTVANQLSGFYEPGARAMLLFPAGINFIIAFLACQQAGMIAVPMAMPRGSRKVERFNAIIKDATPKICLTTSCYLESLKADFHEASIHHPMIWIATDMIAKDKTSTAKRDLYEEVALLQYTSGSTGSPKGVMVTQENILHNSACIQQAFRLGEWSTSVCWLPHFHDMGLIDGIIQPLFSGFHGVLLAPETFMKRPLTWLQLITRFKADHSGGPNSAYEQCLDRINDNHISGLNLGHWRSAYCGAEPIKAKTLNLFSKKFRSCGFESHFFYPCYGMAEATLMISGGDLDQPVLTKSTDDLSSPAMFEIGCQEATEFNNKIVGCGFSWLGTQFKIIHPESLVPCSEGEEGEVWVAGPSVARGYWRQPELSEKIFRAKAKDGSEKSYLRTGDLGLIHNGQLYITGRLKDLIILHGRNHYPQDIEATVQACNDALKVNRGAAFTVEIDLLESLVIVQEVKRTHLTTLRRDLILSEVREAIAHFHGVSPKAVVLIRPGSIPLTSSGKIQRQLCKELYLNNKLSLLGNGKL